MLQLMAPPKIKVVILCSQEFYKLFRHSREEYSEIRMVHSAFKLILLYFPLLHSLHIDFTVQALVIL